ncbi:MAG: heme exporter protein CcmB [Bacteroidota bacterium]
MLYQIITSFKKELQLEWRNKYVLNGVLLYLASTIFICYLSFNVKVNQLDPITWNVLYWIIILFTSISAIAKSFIQEKTGQFLYYYSIMSPQVMIISRVLYNSLLMMFLSLLGLFMYSVVLGNPVDDMLLFTINILLASFGFSSTLTLISAIAAKANNNQTLMTILGFPVLLPILLTAIKISKNAMDGLDRGVSSQELLSLLAINMIVVTISFLLFPYLWRS